MAEDAYVTLLFTDNYLRGAQVLAASLRDGGTTKKLAVVVPADHAHRLLPQTIRQLEESYDYVIPMPTLASTNYSNLALLQRPDLALTLTKINLWRLVQFQKCVYVDADVLALRAPDELFTLDAEFAAAPDVGWPDIFNSGVFVFKPDMATYYALKTLADSGITFDGGDQGLLNTFFPTYHRLSFTYNVTPSTNYQYTPAYRHFSSNITFFHFIGPNKPWWQPSTGDRGSFNEASARWWSVYEKHFGWKIREEEYKARQQAALETGRESGGWTRTEPSHHVYVPPPSPSVPPAIPPPAPPPHFPPHSAPQVPRHFDLHLPRHSTRQYPPHPVPLAPSSPAPPAPPPPPPSPPPQSVMRPDSAPSMAFEGTRKQVSFGTADATFFHPSEPPPAAAALPLTYHFLKAPSPPLPPPRPSPREPSPPPKPFEPAMVNWDPTRTAPPSDAGPEARNLSIEAYEAAWDKPYDPDEPKWLPPPQPPLPEGYEYTPPPFPSAPHTQPQESPSSSEEETPSGEEYHTSDSESPEDFAARGRPTQRVNPVFPWEMKGKRAAATRIFPGDKPATKVKPAAAEPGPRPYDRRASLEKYEFTNAWDHLPIIQSYVKQKLGEAPSPTTSVSEQGAATESPTTPSVSSPLTNMSIAEPDAKERWDPNRAVDKLKSGVMHKVREQQEVQKRSPTKERPRKPPFPIPDPTTSSAAEAGPCSSLITKPKIQIDEGMTP